MGEPRGAGRRPIGVDGSRDLDFWIGSWECSWEGGLAANTVDWVCRGRVLRERFDGSAHGLVGTSISVYDSRAGTWVQTWMDSDGSWFHLTGGLTDGAIELLTTTPDADGYRKQMRFADIEPDAFRWTWSRSRDGAGWEQLWAIDYRRVR
jgi:hypothetical protein